MKTLEILLFAEKQEMVKNLLAPLEIEQATVFDIPAYRSQLDSQLQLHIYPMLFDVAPPEEWLQAVSPFVSGIVLLIHRENIRESHISEKMDKVMLRFLNRPAIVGLVDRSDQVPSSRDYTLQNHSRLLFWDESASGSKYIWRKLVSLISQEAVTAAAIT